MAGQVSVDDNFTFVGGLNVEGGYFTTPKNSWVEGYNIQPNRDGSIERRPAIVFEDNFNNIASFVANTNKAYTVEEWKTVGGRANKDWFVIQIGSRIYFYESFTGTVSARSVSGVLNNLVMDPITFSLEDYRCATNTNNIEESVISVISANGNLVITHQDCDPIFVQYKEDNNILEVSGFKLKIRDFKGIPSPVDPTTEYTQVEWQNVNFWPAALYNLFNQGWTDDKLAGYLSTHNVYPANTKQWVYGKDVDDNFDVAVLDKVDFGTAPAPKGRFILEAFYEDRATALSQMPAINEGIITPTVTPTTPSNGGYWDIIQNGT
jgi:hypothetical protein